MISEKEPNIREWRIIPDEEVNRRFENSKKMFNFTFKDFFFFLTEASKDYLVWEGEVYVQRQEQTKHD